MPSPTARPLPSFHRITSHGYRLGFQSPLPPPDLDQIVASLRESPAQGTDPLRGRVQTRVLQLPTVGSVVIKPYARGGWMRYLSRRLHLRSWTSRAEKEFHMLLRLAADGVPVPQPILWVETGQLLVHKWLITAEIPQSQTFAEIARTDPARAVALLPEIARLIQSLVTRGMHHVDFHPGNVLIDDQDGIFPIDFDKARWTQINRSDLAERYRRRWNRALIKHRLPGDLALSPSDLPSTAQALARSSRGIIGLTCMSLLDLNFPTLPF